MDQFRGLIFLVIFIFSNKVLFVCYINLVLFILLLTVFCPPPFFIPVSIFRSCWKLWRGLKERGNLTNTSEHFTAPLDFPYFDTAAFCNCSSLLLLCGYKQKLLFNCNLNNWAETSKIDPFVWFALFCNTSEII